MSPTSSSRRQPGGAYSISSLVLLITAPRSGLPVTRIAELGLPSETLRKRVRQVEADQGLRPDMPSSQEREQIKELRRENAELRRANEILRAASLFSRTSSARADRSGPVCRHLPGSFWRRADLPHRWGVGVGVYQRKTGRRSEREIEDQRLLGLIRQTHNDNFYALRDRKLRKTLLRAGESAPRCRCRV